MCQFVIKNEHRYLCTLFDILYGDFNYDLIQFGYTPVHMYIYLHDTFMCVYTLTVIHIHIHMR